MAKKRTSVDLSDEDLRIMRIVMERYGQSSEIGVIRLCLRLVAQATEITIVAERPCPTETTPSSS